MWEISELKSRGKVAFKRNYWKCVLVALILAIVAGSHSAGNGSDGSNNNNNNNNQYTYTLNGGENAIIDNIDELLDKIPVESELGNVVSNNTSNSTVNILGNIFNGLPIGVATIFMSLGIMVGIMVILISLFIFSVLEVGGCKFFVENTYEKPEVGTVLSGFKSGNYMEIVLTQLLRSIFVFLWSLLFIIPGIVKSYEYRMIPYILGEYPEMDHNEVFAMSRSMMRGNKMKTFFLDLSFIGWDILNVFTFGLLGLLYVNPYRQATKAELYEVLKSQQISME